MFCVLNGIQNENREKNSLLVWPASCNFTKVPKPIHQFKAYRTKNDVEMFLTGEIEHKMY